MTVMTVVHDLRPQRFGSRHPSAVRDPIVEPMWTGVRVLAAFERSGVDGGSATLLKDGRGNRVEGHEAIEGALLAAARANALIVDACLTKQMAHDGSGVYTGIETQIPTGRLIVQSMVGVRRNRAAETVERREQTRQAQTFEPTDTVTLVATDLLWLDDESLLDVPLLERKRLLEAVLDESDMIRRGLYVRPPIESWVGSWRALGFAELTFKAANSRYRPGTATDDWSVAPMPRR